MASMSYSVLSRFYKKHKVTALKMEFALVVVISGILILGEVMNEDIWGEEHTGVYAGEISTTELADDETVDVNEIKNPLVPKEETPSEDIKIDDTYKNEKLPYYIKINREANCITVYTYDSNGEYTVPFKAIRCATGGENTPLGSFELSDKYKFATLLYQSYGQYCSRIDGDILFHSSTYTSLKKDTLSAEDYNQLGESVSHGCIRLTVADAKWIYDNCDKGTKVDIYDDIDNPGPLGKPETIKVPEGTLWDPTDPDENNPWHAYTAQITGAEDRIVNGLEEFDILEGITAIDTCGNDVTSDIIIESDLDINMPGDYVVTYKITDAIGNSDSKTVIITVR